MTAGRWARIGGSGRGAIARSAMVLVVFLSFVLSPVGLMHSHGPAAWIEAAETVAHGHVHGDDGGHGCHDVTVHDHQLQALATPVGHALPRAPAALARLSDIRLAGRVREEPRRPPRKI